MQTLQADRPIWPSAVCDLPLLLLLQLSANYFRMGWQSQGLCYCHVATYSSLHTWNRRWLDPNVPWRHTAGTLPPRTTPPYSWFSPRCFSRPTVLVIWKKFTENLCSPSSITRIIVQNGSIAPACSLACSLSHWEDFKSSVWFNSGPVPTLACKAELNPQSLQIGPFHLRPVKDS